jgi:SPP1 family predicted phage head-tail adaptor
MIAAGALREVLIIEVPHQERNEVGEEVQTHWVEMARRRASVEQVSASEQQQLGQTGSTRTFTVRMRYCDGIREGCRLRWVTRENRLLYVSSVVERGRMEEHEIYAEERD